MRFLLIASAAVALASAVPATVSAQAFEDEVTTGDEACAAALGLSASSAACLGVSCKWVRVARVYRGAFGRVLWKYHQRQSWCYDGTRITSLSDWRRWPEVADLSWDFKGHVGRTTAGGVGKWHYGTWTQGHFALCGT
ncbi:MAG: hypothetical protein ACRDNG_13380, partial [Gaiellaceae bacterium]